MKKQQTKIIRSALVLLTLAINFGMPSAEAGGWTPTGPLNTARQDYTATLLSDGRVLVAGGATGSGVTKTAELYDPPTGRWIVTGAMNGPRCWHTATRLPSGKVLVVGGFGSNSGSPEQPTQPRADAEIYDPDTGKWTKTGTMAAARAYQTAALLPNGKVLVAGALGSSILPAAEVFDPLTGKWTPTGPMATGRVGFVAVSLTNGSVLVAGGQVTGGVALSSAELYDPAAGAWNVTGQMTTERSDFPAALLADGRALVAGGWSNSSIPSWGDVYDPVTGTWTATDSMNCPRFHNTLTLLPNENILVTGGLIDYHGPFTACVEYFNPTTGIWTQDAPMNSARYRHTATRLANGQVLVAGGRGDGGYLASTELYLNPTETTPPSLVVASPAELQLVGSSVTVTGTASDADLGNHGIDSVTVNGVRAVNDSTNGAGTVNWNCTVSLKQGTNPLVIIARDGWANSTTNIVLVIADVTLPIFTIASPTPNQFLSNTTFLATGTASDNLRVASVWYRLNTNDWMQAEGTTNWSAVLNPTAGTNILSAYAMDTSGNKSSTTNRSFFYVVPAPLQLQVTGKGTLTPNYTNGQPLQIGRAYSMTAAGAAGHTFGCWVVSTNWSGGVTSAIPKLSFMMDSNLTLLANFRDVTRPTLHITSPVNLQQWGLSSVPITGWAKDNDQVTNVQYQLKDGPWQDASGTNAWSGQIEGLVPGSINTLMAYAQDATGNCSLTSKVNVVYNQFLPVNGTYNGLFSVSNELHSAANRLHESSGFLKLTVSGKGSYSGSFMLAGKTYSLGTGQFIANGMNGFASKSVVVSPGNPVQVDLVLSLTPGSDTLSGTLSNSAWVAELHADRAVFTTTKQAPFAGKYTLIFGGTDDPAAPYGMGYGAVTVNSLGSVVLSGSLADGTVLSRSTSVSTNGWWPLYASLYGGKGSIWGWLRFTNNPPADLLGGEVSWIKELQPATMTKYYRLGFTNVLETQGSLYVTPTNATTHVIAVTNGVVSFAGGYPGVAFENLVLLTNKSVVVDQSKTNKLTMKLITGNGTFSGTVLVPGINKTRTFKGAVLQNENVNVGLGYFLGTNLSGRVYFGP